MLAIGLRGGDLPPPFSPIKPEVWPLSAPSETSSTAATPPKRLVTCSSERRATAPYLKTATVFAPGGDYSLGGITLCVVGQSGDRHRRGAPLFMFGLKRTVPAARRAR